MNYEPEAVAERERILDLLEKARVRALPLTKIIGDGFSAPEHHINPTLDALDDLRQAILRGGL